MPYNMQMNEINVHSSVYYTACTICCVCKDLKKDLILTSLGLSQTTDIL